MGLGDLLYSVWKNNDAHINKVNSLAINQGEQYKSYKRDKIHYLSSNLQLINDATMNTTMNTNNNYSLVEGFEGMLGPTQVNVKNSKETGDYTLMENKFNQSLSEYAGAQKILMDKTQNYIKNTSSNNQRNKNIYTNQSLPASDIHPKWKGCYAGGKGLIYQDDLGNNATQSACKTRASDLGYSNFAIAGAKCYVGNAAEPETNLAHTPMVSYAFKTNKVATMGGLLKNGQVGTFKDYVGSNLITDLPAVAGCDAEVGGLINTRYTVASYGTNCNVPPAPPSTIEYHYENTGKHVTWDDSADYAKNKGGRLATYNEILDYLKKNGSVPLVDGDQWVAVTDGDKRDWVQIGRCWHYVGKSHVKNVGEWPPWSDNRNFKGATWNYYVFWVVDNKTVRQQLSELCPADKTNPTILKSMYPGLNYNYDTYMFGACTAAGTCDTTTPDDISKELLDGIKANKKCNWLRFNEGNYIYYDGGKIPGLNSFYDPSRPEGWAKTDCKKLWYDSGAPHMQWGCMQNLWQEAGCTTVMNDADKTLREKYFTLNATDVRKSMKTIATATDDDNRFKCYGADKSKWPSVAPVAPVDLQDKWTKYGCTTNIKDAAKLMYDMMPAEYKQNRSQDESMKEINQFISSDSYTQQVDGYKSYMSLYNNTENDMYKAMPPDVKPTWFNLVYKSYVTPYKPYLSTCYSKDETKWPGYTPKWYTSVYEKK